MTPIPLKGQLASAQGLRLTALARSPSFQKDNEGTMTYSVRQGEDDDRKIKFSLCGYDGGKPEDFVRYVSYLLDMFDRMRIADDAAAQLHVVQTVLGRDVGREWTTTWTTYLDEQETDNPDVDRDDHITPNAILTTLRTMIANRLEPSIARDAREYLMFVRKPINMDCVDFFRALDDFSILLPLLPDYRGLNVPLTTDEKQTIEERAMPESWQEKQDLTGRTFTRTEAHAFYRKLEVIDKKKKSHFSSRSSVSTTQGQGNSNRRRTQGSGQSSSSSSGWNQGG